MENYHVRVLNGDRSRDALEGFLLYCIVVAGKNAAVQQEKLNRFLAFEPGLTPFEYLSISVCRGLLRKRLELVKLGQYNRLERTFTYLASGAVDVFTVTLEELERVPGVGPKSARYFLLYARGEECAALDTHVLKYLRDVVGIDVPKSTPPAGERYRELEQAFIQAAYAQGMLPFELDGIVWQYYARRLGPGCERAYEIPPKEFFALYAGAGS